MAVTEGIPSVYRIREDRQRGTFEESQPKCVFLEVTNRCNLRCAACVRTYRTFEEPRDMSYEEFISLVDQFPQLERAVLHGIGEPLLNPRLPDMVRYLKERGVTVLFNSNATLLTPELGQKLAEAGLDEFRVSVDGADADSYLRLRGKPLLDTVVRNLQALAETKRRLGVDVPRVSLWCIGMRENLQQLPGIVRLAARTHVPEVYVQRLVYAMDGRPGEGVRQDGQALYGQVDAEVRAVIDECASLSEELGVSFRASGATDPGHSLTAAQAYAERPWTTCSRPWTTAYITANGNALPCCISPFSVVDYQELVLGNVWHKPFSEIWNDEPYRSWRRALLGAEPRETCRGCGVWWSL